MADDTATNPPPDPSHRPTPGDGPTASFPQPPGDGDDADDLPDPMPEDSHYRPLRFHKRGGMGRVFVARDSQLNRHVAFKDIQKRHLCRAAAVRQFLFEAEVTGGLEHPGIVPVYGLGRSARGRPFYTMRFVEGESLADAVRGFHANGPPATLSTEQAVALRGLLARFIAVCQTVAYAHSRGVIHRDLKPQNILLGPFGETLVVDWGLAKRLRAGMRPATATPEVMPAADPAAADAFGATRTVRGLAVGTPAYWAPEQAAGAVDGHDERTDVYGLGAVAFAVLTGLSPHPNGVHAAAPPTPSAVSRWIDDGLDGIVTKALAILPADRYASAGDLAADLERWLADQPFAAQLGVVEALKEKSGSRADDPILMEELARQHANLGLMYSGTGRHGDAIREYIMAAGLFKQLSETFRGVPRYRAELANCHAYAANAFSAAGNPEQARTELTAAAAIYDRLITAHPNEYRVNYKSIMLTRANDLPAPPAPRPAPADADSGAADPDPQATVDVPPDPADPDPPPAPDRPDSSGGRGPFTVLAVVGIGGLGRTLLARDNELDRLVAIKEFHDRHGEAGTRRAVREFKITARLEHPHILPVYGTGRQAATGRPFLIMRYVNGATLRAAADEFFAAGGTPGRNDPRFRTLVAAVAAAADAAHFAHTRGVVHRDVKPANILLGRAGEVYLIDWGLTKLLRPERTELSTDADAAGVAAAVPPLADPHQTAAGNVLGTPAFWSPEQARGEPELHDERTDVYLLGATLFYVLTGRAPWVRADDTTTAPRTDAPPPRARDARPDVPATLDDLCRRAMAYHREDRIPAADRLATVLRAWLS